MKRGLQIAGCQPGFFGKALGRQIIQVAVGRYGLDFDQSLADAALEIGVRQPQGYAHAFGQMTLSQVVALVDGRE